MEEGRNEPIDGGDSKGNANGSGDRSGLLAPGHPPIYSKKRKTTQRPKKPRRDGGVQALENLFRPLSLEGETSSLSEASTGAYSSMSYENQTQQNPATPPMSSPFLPAQQAPENPRTLSLQPVVQGDAEQTSPPKPYSNEARVYHARYADLSQAHDEGRFEYCKEGCLAILTEPRLPRYTRVQILQMLSTLLHPNGAKYCLDEAQDILSGVVIADAAGQLLMDDNEKMLTDLSVWTGGRDEFGNDVAGAEDVDMEKVEETDETSEGPSEAWVKRDRMLREQVKREMEEAEQSIHGVQEDVKAELPMREEGERGKTENESKGDGRNKIGLLSPNPTDPQQLERMVLD